jgi:tRNA (guanine37-N1)-methyltransferase
MSRLHVDVLTIFPDMVRDALPYGILRRALDSDLLSVTVHDLRTWGVGPSAQVDDTPFGGGGGMVLLPEPIFSAVEAIEAGDDPSRRHRVLLGPAGQRCRQEDLGRLAEMERLLLICGRYEGVDERVREHLVDEEISIGDYVLSGGELPALVLIEGLARLLPGALGDPDGARKDSFRDGRLDWPAWTRPATFRGLQAPEVLLSGDHGRIDKWRQEKSLELTRERRPDLLQKSGEELAKAEKEPRLTHGRTAR